MSYKLSIITINLDNADGLRKTIESVISQNFTNFEYIVIDGASTDDSLNIIKQYADRITYWISERDYGIFNAMNKGIKKATGEYCLFLNSGDWLASSDVIAYFIEQDIKSDIIAGDIYLCTPEKTILRNTVDEVSYGHFYDNSIPHAASFIKRSLFEKYGLYNENYQIASDWDFFFVVLIIHQATFYHIKKAIAFFDLTGISNQEKYIELQNIEREKTLLQYSSLVYKSYQKLYNENVYLKSHEQEYLEYMHLKNGKCSFIIRSLLYWKKTIKRLFV